MSDILNTAGISLHNTRWDEGEQLSALKFRLFFGSYTKTLTTVCNLLGPLIGPINTAITPYSFDRVISSSSYGMMSNSERTNFESDLARNILGTFNLARVIGPSGALNPTYIPGSLHAKESQGIGYPLASETKVQQLPFPPQREYTWTIVDANSDTWELKESKEEVIQGGNKFFFHIDTSGTLYSSRSFPEGSTIKYDLEVPNTYSYLGAGYNCIPDLSILSLTLEERKIATGIPSPYDWGGVKVSYDNETTSNDVSRWKIELPKVISSRDQMLSTADKTVSNGGFDPVGAYDNGSKYYYLNKDVYTPNVGVSIDDNLIVLYDSNRNQAYTLNLWQYSGLTETVDRTYYATGPKSLEAELKNDAGTLLSAHADTYNSKHFFIFVLGSSLSEQLAQTSLNFSRHKHDGYDSYRVNHRDLLGAEGELQGVVLADQDGSSGGLDFIGYNRQLSYSNAKDNVHPQYLHRLGYRYGGTAGMYETLSSFDTLIDLNAMQGDVLFYPVDSARKTYLYPDTSAYDDADTAETISWDFSDSWQDVADFHQRRGHAVIFGWPYDGSAAKYGVGATKLYYENAVMLDDTAVDNKRFNWSLSRHGFIPGNTTSPVHRDKGLNIGWGNLFFGYREDIFGGRLTDTLQVGNEANALFRTGEFNIVTTANYYAGKNSNSKIKEGYNYRDGFAVRALKGSSIWLSTGSENENLEDIASGKNISAVPGTIALEASFPASKGTTPSALLLGIPAQDNGIFSLRTDINLGTTIASGSGIFLSPGPKIDTETNRYYAPWIPSELDATEEIATLWDGETLGNSLSGALYDGFNHGPGSLLDIFAVAPDRQKNNVLVKGPIPVGRDNALTSWVFGRPFIRGTYGINFCVDGTFLNLSSDFKTGYHKKQLNFDWGPNSPILKTESTEYIHREVRFWGRNEDRGQSFDKSAPGLANTQGANINLLYNFGRDYKRWGFNVAWSDNLSLSAVEGTNAEWSNSRRISLGSAEPSDYGSSIRQASFVEAFAGFRSDPLQPYTASYTVPFRVKRRLGTIAELLTKDSRIEQELSQTTFVLTHDTSVNSSVFSNELPTRYAFATPDGSLDAKLQTARSGLFIDQLIRGSEDMLIQRSGEHINNDSACKIFPASLINFDVKLEYFIGRQTTGGGYTGISSPSTIRNTSPTVNPFKTASSNWYDTITGSINLLTPWASTPEPKSIYIPETGVYVPYDTIFVGGGMESIDYATGYVAKYHKDYVNLLEEKVVMVPAHEAKNDSASKYNIIPTLMKGTGYTPPLDPFFKVESSQKVYMNNDDFNGIVGYDAAIGVVPSTGSNSTYFSRFPNFNDFYSSKMGNNMFCLMLNFGRKLDNFKNSPVPYRVYLGDGSGVESTERVYQPAKINADDGDGVNAEVRITIPTNSSGLYTLDMITIVDGGSLFVAGDSLQITGSQLGETSTPPYNMTLVVGTVSGGAITSFASITGSYNTRLVGTENTNVWVEMRGRLTVNTITALDTEYTNFTDED